MHMPPPEQPPDAAGTVMVDIGGDMGAAVITTPRELAGAEIEIPGHLGDLGRLNTSALRGLRQVCLGSAWSEVEHNGTVDDRHPLGSREPGDHGDQAPDVVPYGLH
jgi:hypothetical protein